MLVDSHCHLDFPDFEGRPRRRLATCRSGRHRLDVDHRHQGQPLRRRARHRRFARQRLLLGRHPSPRSRPGTRSHGRTPGSHGRTSPEDRGLRRNRARLLLRSQSARRSVAVFRTHIAAAREADCRSSCTPETPIRKPSPSSATNSGKAPSPASSTASAQAVPWPKRPSTWAMYVSLSGIVTFKRADELRAIVRDLPLDRLLVETDAPYLAPVPKRGKTNEPAFTAYTAACVAEVKGVRIEETGRTDYHQFLHSVFQSAGIQGEIMRVTILDVVDPAELLPSTGAGAAATRKTRAIAGHGRRSWSRKARPDCSSTPRRTCVNSCCATKSAVSMRCCIPISMPITCTGSTTSGPSTGP